MDIQAQVVGVVSGQTTTGRQKWTVQFSNGQSITAWEYSVAAKAQQAQQAGQVVTARITEKPNPRGGNPYKNLTGIFLPGEAVPADLSPQVTQIPTQTVAGPQNGSQSPTGAFKDEAAPRIARSVAVEHLPGLVAAGFFDPSEDVGGLLDKLSYWIYSGTWGGPIPQAPAVPAEPAAVAQFVAAEAGQPLVQVGTESVAQQPVAALPWTMTPPPPTSETAA